MKLSSGKERKIYFISWERNEHQIVRKKEALCGALPGKTLEDNCRKSNMKLGVKISFFHRFTIGEFLVLGIIFVMKNIINAQIKKVRPILPQHRKYSTQATDKTNKIWKYVLCCGHNNNGEHFIDFCNFYCPDSTCDPHYPLEGNRGRELIAQCM